LEGLLEIVGFEVMVEDIRAGRHDSESWSEFQIVGAAMLKQLGAKRSVERRDRKQIGI